eukprot:TRINITY_DN3928_c0_g2_i1.p1 TRINITY_DN3928_c0_g2~~TRINITY_DN3928_c0_g2_i1.p1  ORF type:complete len:945 (-),score=187.08 TRINITY_DN3928_c0_g2_i1:3831-6347(-)
MCSDKYKVMKTKDAELPEAEKRLQEVTKSFLGAASSGKSISYDDQKEDFHGVFVSLSRLYPHTFLNCANVGLISAGSSILVGSNPINALFDNEPSRIVTRSDPLRAEITVDLKFLALEIQHLTLESVDGHEGPFMKHWEFEGSNCGKLWTSLLSVANDSSICRPLVRRTWPVKAAGSFYKQFRIRNNGPDSQNLFRVALSRLEVYGNLKPWTSDDGKAAELVEEKEYQVKQDELSKSAKILEWNTNVYLCEFRNLNQTVRSNGAYSQSTLSKWHFVDDDFMYAEVAVDGTPARDFNNPNTADMIIGVTCSDKAVLGQNPFVSQYGWGMATNTGNRYSSKYPSGNAFGSPVNEGDVVGILLSKLDGSLEFFRNQTPLGEAFVVPTQHINQALSVTVLMEKANGIVTALPSAFGLEIARNLIFRKKSADDILSSEGYGQALQRLMAIGELSWDANWAIDKYGKCMRYRTLELSPSLEDEKREDSLKDFCFAAVDKTRESPDFITMRAIPGLSRGSAVARVSFTTVPGAALSRSSILAGIMTSRASPFTLGDSKHSWGVDIYGFVHSNQEMLKAEPSVIFASSKVFYLKMDVDAGTFHVSNDGSKWGLAAQQIKLREGEEIFFGATIQNRGSVVIERIFDNTPFPTFTLDPLIQSLKCSWQNSALIESDSTIARKKQQQNYRGYVVTAMSDYEIVQGEDFIYTYDLLLEKGTASYQDNLAVCFGMTSTEQAGQYANNYGWQLGAYQMSFALQNLGHLYTTVGVHEYNYCTPFDGPAMVRCEFDSKTREFWVSVNGGVFRKSKPMVNAAQFGMLNSKLRFGVSFGEGKDVSLMHVSRKPKSL